jgi:hypothetical protein
MEEEDKTRYLERVWANLARERARSAKDGVPRATVVEPPERVDKRKREA